MLIKKSDILKYLGPNVRKARLAKNYTQEFVAENIGVSTDLIRNIENARSFGSLATLLNLCNFLGVTPNYLFSDLVSETNLSLDNTLKNYCCNLSAQDKETLKQIIIHIDKNYC